ncbi:MAG TPA: nicotinate phosphoribosyltransferase [Lachnospiraceae bacterium]|nr:nicotinate phosphoribosyltransferase [Lachnospiraceae bacterium]
MNINPLLALDFYKVTHSDQYPAGLTKMVSYFTPRTSRIWNQNKIILFGLQGFIKEYLIDAFNDFFFSKPKEQVLSEYASVLDNTIGIDAYNIEKIEALHDLGYLPLEIRALPEGTFVLVKVPCIEISNTHPDFVWLVNTIETLLSTTMWHTMVSANVGHMYREIVQEAYEKSVDIKSWAKTACGDFSMRGQESLESATKSSAAFCLSFVNTATVPAALYLERYYDGDLKSGDVVRGAVSTEHSVMCSNYAVDGDEKTQISRLLSTIYPNRSFSMVSDSYDYWNLVTNILPELKDQILRHNGTLFIRGDSGDPVEILAGKEIYDVEDIELEDPFEYNFGDILYDTSKQKYYTVEKDSFIEYELTPSDRGTVWCLWQIFGGTINSKGYKVLDSHIRAIYGDSITPIRARRIYERLMKNGFACNNVTLGVGSFSMQCLQESENKYQPYTRDTFGIAVKATYAEDKDGNPIFIFKNPKTDPDSIKKSQKGCCCVFDSEVGLQYKDGLTWAESQKNNLLETVFIDGSIVKPQTITEIRERVNTEFGGF